MDKNFTEEEFLQELVKNWLSKRYILEADERQKSMGLSYLTAEITDLSKSISTFALNVGFLPRVNSLPPHHTIINQEFTDEGLVRQTVSDSKGTEYERIVHPDEAKISPPEPELKIGS